MMLVFLSMCQCAVLGRSAVSLCDSECILSIFETNIAVYFLAKCMPFPSTKYRTTTSTNYDRAGHGAIALDQDYQVPHTTDSPFTYFTAFPFSVIPRSKSGSLKNTRSISAHDDVFCFDFDVEEPLLEQQRFP